MNHKLFFISFLVLFFGSVSFGNALHIIVYQGQVSFDGKNNLTLKKLHEIPKNVKYFKNSTDIFAIIVDLESRKYRVVNSNQTTTISNFTAKLLPMSSKLFSYVDYMHNEEIRQKATKGAVVGGRKAVNDKDEAVNEVAKEIIFPANQAIFITPTVQLKWNLLEEVFGAKLTIVNNQTQEIISTESVNKKGEKIISSIQPGTYSWSIYSKLEDKKFINQTFSILTKEENQIIINEIADLKMEFEQQGVESQLLLDDYIEKNNYILN